jgi:predicted ester cyclase
VEDVLAEGDKLVTRWSARGTHNGEMVGIPPTGKQISVSGIAIDRFENGQSVEHWEVFDQVGLMQQLGVIPS